MRTNILRKAARAVALAAGFCLASGAAAFEVKDTAGQVHRLADYKGRWVMVNFWATWCVPCIQEIPEIAAFRRERRDVVVLGVAMDADDAAKVRKFAAKVGHDYPLILADEKVEKQLGEPRALPVTRIYDPQGRVVYDRVGRVDRKMLNSTMPGAGKV